MWFGPWFDQENLFDESDEEDTTEGVPKSGAEGILIRPEHPSDGSTLVLTPRRVQVNPVFLRPRGNSPVSDSDEENASVDRQGGHTSVSVVTRAVNTARRQ